MLKIENLRKSYGSQILFESVTFNINPGERVGLVGRNGHGKTTLLRLILGDESPDSGHISTSRGYRLGHLSQLLDFSQETVLKEAVLGLPVDESDQQWKVEKVLSGLGFTDTDMKRPPEELSGGYQIRLNLAKLLVSEPHLLLLDEPTNYLDITAIRWLERFFTSWKGELLIITHDRSFMDSVTTHTMGIHRNKTKKVEGDTGKYYGQVALEEEVHEKSRINIEKKRKQTEKFITRFRAKARLVGLVQSRIKTLEKQEVPEELTKIPTLEFSFRSAQFRPKIMLEVDELSFRWPSERQYLIEDLKLIVGKGERIGVVGPNGKGKTTLLRILAGELEPVSGEIKKHQHSKVGYYGQTNVDRLRPEKTVAEEIVSADPESSLQKARNIAGTMMFSGDDALKRISVLSGGERSRVLLGRLLLEPHNLLLLDEPTNHLDMDSCEALLEALKVFEGAVIIVTHNELLLHSLAQRLVVFDKGKVSLFEGRYREFLEEIGWESEMESGKGGMAGHLREKRSADTGEGIRKDARRESRKARAVLIQERSRMLKPLEVRISELEETISSLESQLDENNKALVDASATGDGKKIAEFAKENSNISDELEKSYGELMKITDELEEKGKFYEEALKR